MYIVLCHRPGCDSVTGADDESASDSVTGPPEALGLSTWTPALQPETPLPCGLLPSQVSDLLFREITPEDYEMLTLLDKNVPAAATASEELVRKLPSARCKDTRGERCAVCLGSFGVLDAVTVLKCKHLFHRSCVAKWLLEQRAACPLCGEQVCAP